TAAVASTVRPSPNANMPQRARSAANSSWRLAPLILPSFQARVHRRKAAHVFDGCLRAQPADFGARNFEAPAVAQVTRDDRLGLCLGERRILGAQQLHDRYTGRTGDHGDLPVA